MNLFSSVKRNKGQITTTSLQLPGAFILLCAVLIWFASPVHAGFLDDAIRGEGTYFNIYWGINSPREFGKTVRVHPLEVSENNFISLGLAREILRWRHVGLEIEALVANHYDRASRTTPKRDYFEYAVFVNLRYERFPWNRYLKTTVAVGEGYSYAEEKIGDENKYGLNYLQLEASFALPHDDRHSLVVRIHHRSGVFGFVGRGDSNYYTFGLRYRF